MPRSLRIPAEARLFCWMKTCQNELEIKGESDENPWHRGRPKLPYSGGRADLQRYVLASYFLAHHYTGSLDRQRGNARMDLPHYLGLHRLFLREKPAGNFAATYLKRLPSNCVHFSFAGSDAFFPDAAFTFVLAAALTLAHRLF